MTPRLHLALLCALCVLGGSLQAATLRPNLLILFTDDMGYRKPGPAYPVPAYNLAIRSCQWKAIKQDQPFGGTNDTRAWELCDLSQDPAELNDLATEFPDKAKELSEAFFAWQKQMPKPVAAPAAAKGAPKAKAKQP